MLDFLEHYNFLLHLVHLLKVHEKFVFLVVVELHNLTATKIALESARNVLRTQFPILIWFCLDLIKISSFSYLFIFVFIFDSSFIFNDDARIFGERIVKDENRMKRE